MGACITSIKVIGVTSLGIYAGSLSYSALQAIPTLINDLGRNYVATHSLQSYFDQVKTLILGSRAFGFLFGTVSTGLLTLGYTAAPPSGKHPYLIYSALGAPLAIATLYYQAYTYEKRLLASEEASLKEKVKPQLQKSVENASNDLDHRDDDSLGKSYIHVSDEESSSTVSTPVSSFTNSPRIDASEPVADGTASIEEEVESALAKKEFVNDLVLLKSSYLIGSAVSGVGFLLGVVGLLGDLYF